MSEKAYQKKAKEFDERVSQLKPFAKSNPLVEALFPPAWGSSIDTGFELNFGGNPPLKRPR